MHVLASDEPVYLTVRNTFFELEGSGTPSARTLRARSEPLSFKVAGGENFSVMHDEEEAVSVASPVASLEDEQPLKHPMLLPTVILRNSTTEVLAIERIASSASPRSCRGDDTCARERSFTYVATPSTIGRRTPENLPRSSVKQMSFALGGDSDDDSGEESQCKTGCLRMPSWTGRRTRDSSPTTHARYVSFAAFDEVVHIPAEEVPMPENAPVASPQREARHLSVANTIPPMAPEIAHEFPSTTKLPWSFSVDAPAFVPKSAALVQETSIAPLTGLPVKVSAALLETSWPCSQTIAANSGLESAPEKLPISDAESKPSFRGPWAKFSEVVESVRACLERSGGIVACAEAKESARGWTIIAYVQPKALRPCRDNLLAVAQQALLARADCSDSVFLLGYGATPFTLMPLGFGAALAHMPDKSSACWASFSKGFCDRPGACCKQHPTCQVGVNVMLKPARPRGR